MNQAPRPAIAPRTRTWTRALALLVAAAAPALATPTQPGREAAPLELLITGDVRGVLGGAAGKVARAHAFVRQRRGAGAPVVLLSSGSEWGPSPTSEVDQGAAALRLMNQLGYDAMALGRKDFFAGPEGLAARIAEARFPVLAANLRLVEGPPALRAAWRRLKPMVTVQRGGQAVAVIGALSPASISYGSAWDHGVAVDPLADSLDALADQARRADLRVLVGTMSFAEAIEVMRRHRWLDLVLCNQIGVDELLDDDGFEFRFRDGRRIVWTHTLGGSLAQVVTGGPERFHTAPVMLDQVPDEDPQAAATIASARDRADEALGEVIGTLTEDERQDFGRAVAEALRHELDQEVALIHKGSFHVRVPPARLTRKALRESYPFTDHGATMAMTGADLKKVWLSREASMDEERHLVFVGIEQRNGVILVNGRALDPGKRYRVAAPDFLTLGGFGPLLKGKGRVHDAHTVDLLERYFARPDRARRIRRLENRRVVHQHTKIDVSGNKLDFSKTGAFQYQEPGTISRGSDIPGLVGLEHTKFTLSLDHRTTIDTPTHDTIFRLDLMYSEFSPNGVDLKAVDRANFSTRFEQRRPGRAGPVRYASFDIFSTLREPRLAGRSRPFFVNAAGGLLWRQGPNRKLYAGLGVIGRESVPGDPTSVGLDLGYELRRPFNPRATWTSSLDGFLSFDSDQVRQVDWRNELSLKVFGNLNTILRHNVFLFKDGTVGDPATKSESFVGLGVDLKARRR